jgi:hypothetical protein
MKGLLINLKRGKEIKEASIIYNVKIANTAMEGLKRFRNY